MAMRGGRTLRGLVADPCARAGRRLGAWVGLGLLIAAGPAWSECTGLPMSQTQPQIDAFMIRPEGLLERFPRGEPGLAIIIAEVVASSYRTTLKPMVRLIDRGNGQQRFALGQGLAMAVRLCQGKDAIMTQAVAVAIAGRQQQDFLNGYYESETARSPPPATTSQERSPQQSGGRLGDPFKVAPLSDPFAPLR